jgi:hypothetical protein
MEKHDVYQIPVSRLSSIGETIRTDHVVYRWFAYLIQQKSVREILQRQPDIRSVYGRLARAITQERQLLLVFLFYLFLVLLSRQYFYGWGTLVFFYPRHLVQNRQKISVEQISLQLISNDFTPDRLGGKTLYQICEHYASCYHIASLVDIIGFANDVLRKATVVVALILWLIYPLNAVLTISGVLIAYHLIRQAVTSFPVLQHFFEKSRAKQPWKTD